MAIIYYPTRVYKGKVPAIDRTMSIRKPISATSAANISSNAVSDVISNDENWQVDSIGWTFSNANPRTFNAYIMYGRHVVEHYNDYLWFQITGSIPQRIVLTPGYYTGTQLATQLQTQLNANAGFIALNVTFVVAYSVATGLYTITPSSGNIRYLNIDASSALPYRDSIAGHLFGLTVDTAFAGTVVSDTAVFGLDSEVAIVSQTGSDDLTYSHNEVHTMTIDQALHLTSNSGSDVTMTYVVNYETIV